MNEFDDGGLNSTVQQLRAEVEKLTGKLSEVSKRLIDSEEQYVALQKSNNEKWTKINGLQADLQKLGNQAEAYKLEKEYWMGQYQLEMSKSEAQEAAYLKVIKALSNRD